MYNVIQEFLNAELITESHSPYVAPAFLAKKHDDTHRFVDDYKKLNLITIKDSSPLLNMETTVRKLGEAYKYFSKLDLKSGFYQIPIKETDKEKTAFTTPFGLFQFNVLPMGLKNSPSTFQKVMVNILTPVVNLLSLILTTLLSFPGYMMIIFLHLTQVFIALSNRNFVLNPSKMYVISVTNKLSGTYD